MGEENDTCPAANGSREKSEVFRSRHVHVFGFRWHVVAAVFEKVPLEKKKTTCQRTASFVLIQFSG